MGRRSQGRDHRSATWLGDIGLGPTATVRISGSLSMALIFTPGAMGFHLGVRGTSRLPDRRLFWCPFAYSLIRIAFTHLVAHHFTLFLQEQARPTSLLFVSNT